MPFPSNLADARVHNPTGDVRHTGVWVYTISCMETRAPWRVACQLGRVQALPSGQIGTSLRILIVDDHEAVRAGVRVALEKREGVEVCGEAGNGREALDKIRALKPDVVILDITMPVLDGFSTAREINKILPGVAILLLSMHESQNMINVAKSSGARGYVAKSDGIATLVRALDALAHNQTFFPN